MSKSLLITNTPKKCTNCVLCYRNNLGNFICKPRGQIVPSKGKSEFCPLQKMPKQMNGKSTDFNLGWNYCLIRINGELEGLEDD